jgi:cytochrome c-type biogenesis protein
MGALVLAALNPCGFSLLPTYLTMFLGPALGRASAIRRALTVRATVKLGCLAVFAMVGVVVSTLSATIGNWLSVVTAVSGVA